MKKSKPNSLIRTYDGKRRSRTEALQCLCDALNFKDRLLITIDPDPDSIASALALKRLLWRRVQATTIGMIRPIKRLNNLTLVRLLRLPVIQLKKGQLKNYDQFLLVDGQPHHNEWFDELEYTAVIDHHPLVKEVKAPFVDIRPEYGATSTILTEYLRAAKIKPSKTLATALTYGIKTDTASFSRKTLEEDVKAFRYLFPLANRHVLNKIEISDLSAKDLNYYQLAIEKRRVVKDRIYAHLEQVPTPDILVMVADFLLRVHDISWSIVSGINDNRLVIIVRNDGYRKDAGRTVARAFSEYGSAGGHQAMARAEIPLEALRQAVPKQSSAAVDRFIRRRMSAAASSEKSAA